MIKLVSGHLFTSLIRADTRLNSNILEGPEGEPSSASDGISPIPRQIRGVDDGYTRQPSRESNLGPFNALTSRRRDQGPTAF